MLDGADGGDLAGVRRFGYDGSELPVRPDEVVTAEVTTRDIDRGDSPHFLLEGDRRGTRELPQDPARQDRRARRCLARRRRNPGVPRVDRGPAGRRHHHTHPRHRAGHRRGRRPEHGIDPRRAVRRQSRHRRHHGDRAVGVQHAPRHERHARDRRQPERHHHRHQPDGRPAARPGCRRARHRQPSRERSRRQGRRHPVHVRRTRRRDERGVDQGVLRPGRGRCAAGVRDLGSRRTRERQAARCVAQRPALDPRRDARRHRQARRRSPTRRAGSPRRSGTGPSSATDPTGSPPRRSGSSSASSATSRSPATPPRTRSTSICHRSR